MLLQRISRFFQQRQCTYLQVTSQAPWSTRQDLVNGWMSAIGERELSRNSFLSSMCEYLSIDKHCENRAIPCQRHRLGNLFA